MADGDSATKREDVPDGDVFAAIDGEEWRFGEWVKVMEFDRKKPEGTTRSPSTHWHVVVGDVAEVKETYAFLHEIDVIPNTHGVYEWKIEVGSKGIVVYVGKGAGTGARGGIWGRIQGERSKLHGAMLNVVDALYKRVAAGETESVGFFVRWVEFASAKSLETALLKKYSYALNDKESTTAPRLDDVYARLGLETIPPSTTDIPKDFIEALLLCGVDESSFRQMLHVVEERSKAAEPFRTPTK
jgi:hypothetical protein